MAQLALLGGSPAKTKPFPEWPQFDHREREALLAVLDSRQWWRTPGTRAARFEKAFARLHDARFGLALTNGTQALEVALLALDVGPGDEVIVPDYTFVATASAVLMTGALSVIVDVEPRSFCIDPDLVEQAITPRTKAIIAVHVAGHPVDLDRLLDIAGRHEVALVEDCAHAHASEWCNRKVGTFGIAGTFSFQQSKLMTAGEGGMIITGDEQVERLARSVHDCGRMPGEWFYSHFIYGSNYRISEWQAAVLEVQLERLDEQTARRHENGRRLDALLAQFDGITPQAFDPRCTRNSQYAYIFHYDRAAFSGVSAARFIKALEAEGVPNQAAYPPLHALELFTSGAYRRRLAPQQAGQEHGFLSGAFPHTARAARETFWIEQRALLGDHEDMHEIAAAVRKIQWHAKELL